MLGVENTTIGGAPSAYAPDFLAVFMRDVDLESCD